MFDTVASEFPFVEALPKREKSKLVKLWDRVFEFGRISGREGGLVTVMVAARLLGLSRTRIDQLVAAGRLRVVPFEGHVFISCFSIEEYAKQEKSKGGRPRISPSEAWEMSIDSSRQAILKKK